MGWDPKLADDDGWGNCSGDGSANVVFGYAAAVADPH